MNMNGLLEFVVPGGWELVLIVIVVLLLFGAKKIPELAKGLGTGIKEFKKATNEINSEVQRAMEDEPAKSTPSQSNQQSASSTNNSQSDQAPKA